MTVTAAQLSPAKSCGAKGPPRGSNGGSGNYKIIDVVVEGISMAITPRSEFASVIQRGGGAFGSLLTQLRKRTNRN